MYTLNSRHLWGSLSREVREPSLAQGLLISCAEELSTVAQKPFGHFCYQQRTFHGGVCQQSLSQQKASKVCQRTGLQPVSFSSMTYKNSLYSCFICVPPKSILMAVAFFADLLGSKTIILLNAAIPFPNSHAEICNSSLQFETSHRHCTSMPRGNLCSAQSV